MLCPHGHIQEKRKKEKKHLKPELPLDREAAMTLNLKRHIQIPQTAVSNFLHLWTCKPQRLCYRWTAVYPGLMDSLK